MIQDNIKTTIVPEMKVELNSILNFWAQNTIDKSNGGFVAELNGDGKLTDADEKGAVLNTRLLWSFSAAYNFLKDPAYLVLADRAYDYLIQHFWDKENGGLFWSVTNNGSVKNSRKQAYAQGFAVYGFSEYYKASGKQESLDYAIKLFNIIEDHFKDEKFGGYIEALGCNWQPLTDMRLSEKDANQPKSMNTHLHIIEPFTNLYRVWPNDLLKDRIQNLVRIFRDKIIDPKTFHFNLFFDMDWTVKSNIVSYGHDIEGTWLLNEAAHVIRDEELIGQMKDLSIKMADITLAEGTDKDGSIFYELEGGHIDTDKHWWPQAEAMIGFLDAYQNSGHIKYFNEALLVWNFIQKNIKDNVNGEWFWKVDENGNPDKIPPKVGFWKCPYHNSRALIEAITRIDSIKE
ncbi:AGE family epimerase/isomerase [Ancylomarina sp. 16SWW S1-10-2]|uniref:AGE family epimerase/isomerase n=1 Tax=Ancylomarina sp. 16SWW S1-10-2 TaxID=2499681 RepID=UPI0012AE897C|nr:AGE family epimerase/isomerase [Ancylomarina sp. 16SWW S1-10-2]MRT93702.1 N-acyl-D-glucosamine 2-epimerase [Ancylomarina sp. 16SWW S1-10-2]